MAHLRTQVGAQPEDTRLEELVGQLAVHSKEFRRLWARRDVQPRTSGGTTTLGHPQVGRLELRYEKLAIAGGDGVTLVIYHAEPVGTKPAPAGEHGRACARPLRSVAVSFLGKPRRKREPDPGG